MKQSIEWTRHHRRLVVERQVLADPTGRSDRQEWLEKGLLDDW